VAEAATGLVFLCFSCCVVDMSFPKGPPARCQMLVLIPFHPSHPPVCWTRAQGPLLLAASSYSSRPAAAAERSASVVVTVWHLDTWLCTRLVSPR
jgi:hypothetical protein